MSAMTPRSGCCRRAPIHISTTAPATTGRMPTAARNARPSMLAVQPMTRPSRPGLEDNPLAPHRLDDEDASPSSRLRWVRRSTPLGGDDLFATPAWNPFAPTSAAGAATRRRGASQAGPTRPRTRRLSLVRAGSAGRSASGGLCAVRAALGVPTGRSFARAVPAAAGHPAARRRHLRRDHPGGTPARPRAAAHRGGLCGPRVARFRGRGGVSRPDPPR